MNKHPFSPWRPWLVAGLCVFISLASRGTASGQPSAADFQRARDLRRAVVDKVLNKQLDVSWSPDGRWLWYRLQGPDGKRTFNKLDTQTGKLVPAFDHRALAVFLQKTLAEDGPSIEIDPERLPVQRIKIDDQGNAHLLVIHERGVRRIVIGDQGIRLSEQGADTDDDFALKLLPADSQARSRNSPVNTDILFTNPTDRDARIEWVDASGNFQVYATLKPGQSHRQHTFVGHVWRIVAEPGDHVLLRVRARKDAGIVVIPDKPVTAEHTEQGPPDRSPRQRDGNVSPDGRWGVALDDHNLVLVDRETDDKLELTTSGSADDPFEPRVYWSPDSKHLIAVQTSPAQEHPVSFVEAAPPDQLQPKLHTFDYLKPGDRIARPRPRLFDVESRKEIPTDNALFDQPWSIDRYHWAPDSSACYFLYNQRGHQALRVIALDAKTGEARAVVDEHSDTFIDYSNKTYLHHFDDTNQLLWMSERDGWNHLYLIDRAAGEVVRQITQGPWLVKRVDRLETTDDGRRLAYLTILGHPAYASRNPYAEHHARVNIDTGELTLLTQGNGTHTLTYAPDGRHYVDSWSRPDQPPVHELRRSADGSLVCELARADASGWLSVVGQFPEPFVAKGRDGKTDIWGIIYRPTDFDPNKRYPVLESIYAGPQDQYVPKSFAEYHGAYRFTELGFIVVQIDGMGTNWRSKAFHDVAWKNLKDAGFPDRIAWMKAAAQHEPAMDLSRVGVYGTSAGGQNAMRAVLDHADFYKAAMADSGCHDNRMDKVWWNEAWMGYPVDESYVKSSNVVDAHKLGGALLLIVGGMDRNVDPASTFQVVQALVKADKNFEMLVFPEAGHGAGTSDYGWRRTADFFVRHLGGPETNPDAQSTN